MGSITRRSSKDSVISINKMMSKMLPLLTLVSSLSASPLNVESTKAASPYVNLGCQCSSLTFADQYGSIQGNCRSADSTGARWCYVDSAYSSTCQDLQFSARFPNNPWSYEACATPLPVVVAPAAPSASFTAPYVPPHSHVQQVPSVPAHQHVPIQSGAYTSGIQQPSYGIQQPNYGTLQPYGQFIPKTANNDVDSSAVKF